MIDVHCLVHKECKYFDLLKDQMSKEKANFFIVQNGANIGEGRVKGFSLGTSPFVSFVDYDDRIAPGVFEYIDEVMKGGVDWCYTDEIIIDGENNIIAPGWSSHPQIYVEDVLNLFKVNEQDHCHHIITFRRELLTREMGYVMRQLTEMAESYLVGELRRSQNYLHIQGVGYFWRIHGENAILRADSYLREEFQRRNNSIFREEKDALQDDKS